MGLHNRFSVLVSVLLPYAAISDRLANPPTAIMFVVLIVTIFQYPLYGAVLGASWAKGRLPSALAGISVVHASASGVAIYMKMARL